MERIKASLRNKYSISHSAMQQLISLLDEIRLPKKSVLINPMNGISYYYFIEKGLTRTYMLSNGKDITNWFNSEGEMVFTMNYHRNPGQDYVELLEDCSLYRIGIAQLNQLFKTNIELGNWSRWSNKQIFMAMETRHQRLITLSATQRYRIFMEENPGLFKRIELGHLASFLGMSQVTLSRIRAKEYP